MNKIFILFIFLLISCSRKNSQDVSNHFQDLNLKKNQINIENQSNYVQLGVGGGGAMTSLSFSPYSNLWLVGTDMGTLFRSSNNGSTWHPIDKKYFTLTSNLSLATKVGFFANGKSLIFSNNAKNIFLSNDSGESWDELKTIELEADERIIYFRSISNAEESILLATNSALYLSENLGRSWRLILKTNKQSIGTFVDYQQDKKIVIYHADEKSIYISYDTGLTWTTFTETNGIQSFTGGRDARGLTLVYSDKDGESACQEIYKFSSALGMEKIKNHISSCGYVWISKNNAAFKRTLQMAGDHIAMAENDSRTLFITGSTNWIRQYGTKVWRSTNAGDSFELVLHQYNWDTGNFTAWDESKLERSAVALDVGWDDNGYVSFETNLRNANEVGGTGFYFLFTSLDKGIHWRAPFTKYADIGKPAAKKNWSSNGLEVTSVYRIKQHTSDPSIIYSGMADISGMISEDNGKSWRITKALTNKNNYYNSIYDYAFTTNKNEVFAAASTHHDFPNDGWNHPNSGTGGVLFSADKGRSWQELTSGKFALQYLSIALDETSQTIYAGTQGKGIVVSNDFGKSWSFKNNGLPLGDKVVPQVEIDPTNGDVYALITGNAYGRSSDYANWKTTGIYLLKKDTNSWIHLRGTINPPQDLSTEHSFTPWLFPVAFAVDFNSENKTLYLADAEKKGKWMHSGVWKSTNNGQTWDRVTQYTHPRALTISPFNSNEIHVSGLHYTDGSWGEGGLMYSVNGGESWKRNDEVQHKTNATFTLIDQKNENNIFYGFHGSAIIYGPKPE